MTQSWNPDSYEANARFVTDLGAPVLELLDPMPGERILDLGCGDGPLTLLIAEAGADVLGVDASPEMIEGAKARGLDARVVDAHDLPFDREFDAVFSNAALHWMKRPDDVIAGVARALKPGGRFVAEMGGHGCVAAVLTATLAVLAKRGVDGRPLIPWYFPTPDDYSARLERAGFEITTMLHFPRATPLPGEMTAWLDVFANPFLDAIDDRDVAKQEISDLLRPSLCDDQRRWTADYVRLRFSAKVSAS